MADSDRGQRTRRLAWEVLWRTYKDRAYPDRLLAHRFGRHRDLSRADRALTNELVLGTLRWQLSLDFALSKVCRQPLKRLHPKLLILLRLGAYQLLFLHRIPASAAVNEAVKSAASLRLPHAAGLANAVLRNVQRQGTALLAVDQRLPAIDRLVLETSHPRWMVARWLAQWGFAEAQELCRANNHVPPLVIRANTLKVSPQALTALLTREGVTTGPPAYCPEALYVETLPDALDSYSAYMSGAFSVQDEASQLISHWVDVRPGQDVLDACAAPGGKATHLAHLMQDQGHVVAADIHAGRLQLLQRAIHRQDLRCVETVQADLTDPRVLPGRSFDRILLDAPCTGLGVLRRHPDAKWRRHPQDPARMAAIQLRLLTALVPKLRPGGMLIYSVCTHTDEETVDLLQAFLTQAPGIEVLASADGLPPKAHSLVGTDGLFRSFPHRHGLDGFTAFKVRRR
jgi:16S rRNA (cytosine967-C5)-methyltransferase